MVDRRIHSEMRVLGRSREGRPLEVTAFGPQTRTILFLGGVHGDEIEGVWLMRALMEAWDKSFPERTLGALVWPEVNPDGVANQKRWNGSGVDLNRNLPSKDWSPEVKNPRYPPGPEACSEPENRALVKLIREERPVAILSAHSFHRFQINVNGPTGEWGARLHKICGYPVTEDIGYPTPGCLGTYSGRELCIPTITLEIERGISEEQVLNLHVPVIEESLAYWSEEVADV